MADTVARREWDDQAQAQTIWDAIRATRTFDRCPVIYQYKKKPLLYTLYVDGRILIAWPNLDIDRLEYRVDFNGLAGHGVVLPRFGKSGLETSYAPDLRPVWLAEDVNAVPLFALRGTSGHDSALLLAAALREDVRANLGRNRRIGLSPPGKKDLHPTESRVVSADGLHWQLVHNALREQGR